MGTNKFCGGRCARATDMKVQMASIMMNALRSGREVFVERMVRVCRIREMTEAEMRGEIGEEYHRGKRRGLTEREVPLEEGRREKV